MNFSFPEVYTDFFWCLGVLSIITLFFSLLIIPLIIIRIPEDYFIYEERRKPLCQQKNIVIRVCYIGLKNCLGVLFLFAGIAMLILPGQGIMTILIGLMIMNFPGKYRLEKRFIQFPKIYRAINWIRLKAHKLPLQYPSNPR